MDLKTESDTSNQNSFEKDESILSIQVLEFKTSLLDAVQELHIRRDAETRYEEQINKLVLEKQELEWEKESVQHQINTVTSQHNEALDAVKKRFQAQIRGMEEDKGKHQLTAELREKEMTSLKEELKSLQLCKYSLEKKLGELEQKLELQSQSKDGHLKQLGEVEQRFGVVARQCAVLKQAHDRLQQNVEEAVKLNKKLTTINKSQASKINTITQDAERLNGELIKSKVLSAYQSGEDNSGLKECERQIQQLQQRLRTETEMNKKLHNENEVGHLEKQEVLTSLQHTQQLLQTQTQALSRSQAELLAQREEYQALRRQHELVLEEARGKEEKFGRLKEECKKDNILWEKEKRVLEEKLQGQQQELGSVREAYEHLHEKHKQLTSARLHTDNNHNQKREGMQNKEGNSQHVDGQQLDEDAPIKSVSLEEQIDSQSAVQGNDTTKSETVPAKSTVIDVATHPTEVQQVTVADPPSKQTAIHGCAPPPAHVDSPPTRQPAEQQVTKQSCPADQSAVTATTGSSAPALAGSQKNVIAKDAPSDAAMSAMTDLNKSQAPNPGLPESNQTGTSFTVDETSSPDNNNHSSNSTACQREGPGPGPGLGPGLGLSLPETSSVYDGKGDPGLAGGKGEVGVVQQQQQQTACTPEARLAVSLDKAPDSQAVSPAAAAAAAAITTTQGPVATQPQPQMLMTQPEALPPPPPPTPPPSALIAQNTGGGEVVPPTQTAGGQCSTDDTPMEVTLPTLTQQNGTTHVLPGPETHTSTHPQQHPVDLASTQCPNQTSHAGLQPTHQKSCSRETKVLHGQNVSCGPPSERADTAAQVVCPETERNTSSAPASAADLNGSLVAGAADHLRSPELFPPSPPDSSTEAPPPPPPPQAPHGPSEQPCTTDDNRRNDQSNNLNVNPAAADASVTHSQTSKTSSETGADERSHCQAAADLAATDTATTTAVPTTTPTPAPAPGTKTHRSSFVWGGSSSTLAKSSPLMMMMSSHGVGSDGAALHVTTQSSSSSGAPVCTMSQSAPGPGPGPRPAVSTTPRGFLEASSAFSFTAPIFQQGRLNKRDSTAHVRIPRLSDGAGADPGHRRDQSKDWNAIRRSLSEMTTAGMVESRLSIPFSLAPSAAPPTPESSQGNDLRQDCTPSQSVTHPRQQARSGGGGGGTGVTTTGQWPVAEGCPQGSQQQARLQDRPTINIRDQIAKLEQFLSSEGVSLPKKSKIEE